jgi:murein DD-endopeptidase MepM/ murein hydrolase activator NlpD
MCGYAADTGLDICSKFAPVYAVAAGTLDYSEPGHTSWNGPRDTANSVRLKLDVPFVVKGRRITHVYYTHLSGLRYRVPESGPHRHVAAGEQLGVSGTANDVPHLHLGFIVNGRVAQDTDDDILKEWDVRLALGSYAPGEDLPAR